MQGQTTIPGLLRKQEGQRKVEENKAEFLAAARRVARTLSQTKGGITAEDVRSVLESAFPDLRPTHVNAWGAIFRGKGWVAEAWAIAKRPEAHARPIRVWRYDP